MYAHIFSHSFVFPSTTFKFLSLCHFGYHFIISLVTGKNKYQINALMKNVSYGNI